ncbi:glycosyltransferase family protein [Oecophyllibacter saccharovorans]|uniref:glycosyltransferase family protein n=1 Tax=Oecophyllibacter saccharovorans TaxID=2558360 RepID=UPI0011685436|nr:glycosyltransferase [Oecophyllibacter saccharovorans]TPW34892.1 glycosyltransferase family 1 protein [Oecophyllibacter saccharovorans]
MVAGLKNAQDGLPPPWQGQPLKIVHVSDFFFSLKKTTPSQFGTGGKLSNGLVRNGHQVIDISYRDVARAGGWCGSRWLGRRALCRGLEAFVASARPDVLLLGHGYMIPPETIARIRSRHPGMASAQWNVDALFVPDNRRDFAARHQVVDASFATTAGPILRRIVGPRGAVGFLPNPVDFSVERSRNFLHKKLEADLFYACGQGSDKRLICGQWWNMESFLTHLLARLPGDFRLNCAGVRGQPYRRGADYARLLATAAMGLNASRRSDAFLYSSDRLAHMIGNGQLVFMERSTAYQTLFSEGEMAFFSSLEELADLLTRYRAHPAERQRVARAGWEKYGRLFNERRVADYLIRFTLGLLKEGEYPWRSLTPA